MNSDFYFRQQKLLVSRKWYRRFWMFWGIYVVGFFYCGVVLFFLPRWRAMATLALAAFLFARFVICEAIYFFYKKVRPYQKLHFLPPFFPLLLSFNEKRSNSMPSGHAASLMAVSCVCLAFLPWLGLPGIVAAIFNGIARVILGYHYPSDVLAGWLVGIFSAFVAVYWFAPALFTR
jgi:membrane-associated phospholipid phosphatase